MLSRHRRIRRSVPTRSRATARAVLAGVTAVGASAVLTLVWLHAPAARADSGCPSLPLLSCQPAPTPTPPPAPSPGPTPSPAPLPAPAPQPAPAPGQPAAGTDEVPAGEVPGAAAHLLDLVNRERAAAGAPTLAGRAAIAAIAQAHSKEMAGAGQIWHNDAYFTTASHTALGAAFLGENVALNNDVDDAHRRLMASPGHRANILDARFSTVGFSVVSDGKGELFVTEDFLQPVTAKPAPPRPQTAPRAPEPQIPPASLEAAASGEVQVLAAADPLPVPRPELGRQLPADHSRGTPGLLIAGATLLVLVVSANAWRLRSLLR